MPISKSSTTQHTIGLAVVFIFYILTTAILILHFRRDVGTLHQVSTMASYAIFYFGIIAVGWQYLSREKALWVAPVATILFVSSPFLVKKVGAWSTFLLFILGAGFILLAKYRYQPKFGIHRLLTHLIYSGVGALLGLYYFVQVNGAISVGAAHIFADLAVYTDSLHLDTLFHSAIMNMIAKFSIPSIGLDGVSYQGYHVGIHRWIAASQTFLQARAPLLLAIALQVALIPVAFFSWILALSALLRKPINLLVLLSIGFITIVILSMFVWDSYLLSESHVFSLTMLFSLVPIGRSWLERACERKNHWFSIPPWQIAVVMIVVILCTTAKVSTGVIAGSFLIYCIVIPKILHPGKRPSFGASIAGAIALLLCLGLAYIYIGTPELNWFPLHFARHFPTEFLNEIILFISFIGIHHTVGYQGALVDGGVADTSYYEIRHRASTLVLAITFLTGLLPGLILDIPGGSAYYFSHPALLIVVLWGLSAVIDYYAMSQETGCLRWLHPRFHNWQPVSRTAILSIASLLMFTLFVNWPASSLTLSMQSPFARFQAFSANTALISDSFSSSAPIQASSSKLESVQQSLSKLIDFPSIDLTQFQETTGLGSIERALDEEELSTADQALAVYIDPEFDHFWATNGRRYCWDRAFEIPAMLGLPLVNGVRGGIDNCSIPPTYGMADFDSSSWNTKMSDAQLCQKARSSGLTQLLIITSSGHRVLRCAAG